MTLSSYQLKASTSFFIRQGWPALILVSEGVRRHPGRTARGALCEGYPPCTRLGVAMTIPWGGSRIADQVVLLPLWLGAGSGKVLIGGSKAHCEPFCTWATA